MNHFFFPMRTKSLLLGLSLIVMTHAQTDQSVTIAIQSSAPAGTLAAETRFSAGPGGVRYLEGTIRNTSTGPVTLDKVTLRFPWLATTERDLLIAAGGTTMVWPVKIFSPATATGRATSGTYLQARHDGRYSLLALVTWNTFWTELAYADGQAVVTADGEGRRLAPGEILRLETLRLSEGDDWARQLTDYADDLAERRPTKLKPRRTFIGWSTWDYYGRTWTAQTIRDHLAVLRPLEARSNLVQIDGGWWPRRGDYLGVRANLEPAGGMRGFAADIRRAGFEPGIHFDGGRGDSRSAIYAAHPDYFLHDDQGKLIGQPQVQAREQLENIYFDYSHPGAQAYLREVTRTMRRDWGYDYIKIDFLWYNLAWAIRDAVKLDPARRIAPHNPATTSVERLHLGMKAFREGMGDDAWFLGCGAPFGIVLSYVDSLRTGFDIWPNLPQFASNAAANAGMFYLHERTVYNDADYQISRAREDQDATLVPDKTKDAGGLKRNEAELWANYVGLFSTAKLNSDNLLILRPERRELFTQAVNLPNCRRFVPLDFWQHARTREDAFHVMLGETPAGECYLAFFNWGDEPRTYRLDGLGNPGLAHVVGEYRTESADKVLNLTLLSHRSAVFKFPAGADYEHLRRTLTVQ